MSSLAAPQAAAVPPADPGAQSDLAAPTRPADRPAAVDERRRDALLGGEWRQSDDLAWTTSGDGDGFHILAAEEKDGYAWRTVATLSEPGFEADQWIGNACLTGSGKRLVVVYAPRTFTNKPELSARGGFTAVIDLETGNVRKLAVQTSLAYFNPGCGTGETAVLTQEGVEDQAATRGKTRLLRVDSAKARVSAKVELAGQVTSPVPIEGGVVAADGRRLVLVRDGGERVPLLRTRNVPLRLRADADGGVVFLDHDKDEAVIRRADVRQARELRAAEVTDLARGKLGSIGISAGAGGRVFLTGELTTAAPLPATVDKLAVPASAQASTHGRATLTSVDWASPSDPRTPAASPAAARPVNVSLRVTATGQQVDLTADTQRVTSSQDASGGTRSPALEPADTPAQAAAESPHEPVESERSCSVPRNDPRNQARQPKPRQVEWAVDQAVRGALVNDYGMGSPQGMFPRHGLVGGGFIPAQVMLGVTAQESNMWQASRLAVPGETGNPLIGNYYGLEIYNSTPDDDWDVRWDEADCGYGVTQVTDGMRLAGREKPGERALPYAQQRAVALDFTVNIAAGVRILEDKWNQTANAGMKVNNGDPAKLENWFFALWAYNSGFYPDRGDGFWGVGWANNPINPRYPADRAPFLETGYIDAKNPQRWPYPEKVLGWAGHPLEALESPDTFVVGYRPAWWNGDTTTGPLNRRNVKPPRELFCNSSNYCYPGEKFSNNLNEPAGPCSQSDLRCWFHTSATWKSDCSYSCGNEVLRFDPGYPYQADGTAYPPACGTSGLPSGSLVIDNLPGGTPTPRCGATGASQGSFTFTFGQDSQGNYPSKIDLHQIGGGYAGHYYFGHTRAPDRSSMRIEGTWTLGRALDQPAQILVHLPDHYGYTHRATYHIETAHGTRTRTVSQRVASNQWLSLGAFMFDGVPKVRLSTVLDGAQGEESIAFDAIAVQPVRGTYTEHTVDAVALFDENQNIDSDPISSWFMATPLKNRSELHQWGLRVSGDVTALPTCTSGPDSGCAMPRIKAAMQAWNQQVREAGTDPVDHPPGKAITNWIHLANPYTDRPTSSAKPSWFNNRDDSYKVKASAAVSFVRTDDGAIVDGSQWADYDDRTGNTILPQFVMNTFKAISDDYGIQPPDLTYTIADLNEHDGRFTTVRPNADGVLPGRAYLPVRRPAALVDNGACVAAKSVSGGMIGYRPILGVSDVIDEVRRWRAELWTGGRGIPTSVAQVATEIYLIYFADSGAAETGGSLFNNAPPIWQQLDFKVCADGVVRQNGSAPVLRSSFMPDQYLYHNGQAIDLTGRRTGSAAPVVSGNFQMFSRLPRSVGLWDSAYGACTGSGQVGNPWDLSAPRDAGVNPDNAHLCE
ncbi:hypothetical protein OG339_27960 [Streptosporangium sp. NBC_01495]|uniref:golvesin C-terminal-like domain-containing protein n=1 Tax=Streptosporangium sp. NBC_01495 TaxID=2903899 RepID=UPI002E30E4A1|nr:hypothetical protein [Streptosporangium sp. NBC_01495]